MEDLSNIYVVSNPYFNKSKTLEFRLLCYIDEYYILLYKNLETNKVKEKKIQVKTIPSDLDSNIDKEGIDYFKLYIDKVLINETDELPEDDEASDLTYDLIGNVADILDLDTDVTLEPILKHDSFYELLNKYLNQFEMIKLDYMLETIIKFFYSGKLRKGRQLLSRYLTHEGFILKKETGAVYKVDNKIKGYNYLTFDDCKIEVAKKIGKNVTNDKDIKEALTFIDDRLEPVYDIIKFKNCMYDIKEHKIIKPETPIFTSVETKYNYNPDAQGLEIKDFLYSSFEKKTAIETAEYVKGVLQFVGYLFTSGNIRTVLAMLVGVSGGGKSIFSDVLSEIFGKEKIADMKIQDLDYTHATSQLLDKHLNIINDADDRPIQNIGLIKQLSGYDSISINPKGKDSITIPREEVAKMILVANAIPVFRKLDSGLLERFLIIEFNIKFRGTEKEDKHLLEKLLKPDNIEWLIYNGLEAYKELELKEAESIAKGEIPDGFILKRDIEETKDLVAKYTNPLNYIIRKLILKHDKEAFKDEVSEDDDYAYITIDDLNTNILKTADYLGLELEPYKNKSGKVDPRRILPILRNEFNLNENYKTESKRIKRGSNDKVKRYYPDLIKDVELWEFLNDYKVGQF